MIVSDAKTAVEFRAEVVAELQRRSREATNRAIGSKLLRELVANGIEAKAMALAAEFFNSIEFR